MTSSTSSDCRVFVDYRGIPSDNTFQKRRASPVGGSEISQPSSRNLASRLIKLVCISPLRIRCMGIPLATQQLSIFCTVIADTR